MADEQKKALVAQLDQQRHLLFKDLQSVKRELSPGRKLKQSVQKHPARWAAGAAGVAFLGARLLRSKKVVYTDGAKKSGFIMGIGKLAFNLSRPALTAFAIKQVQDYAEARLGQNPANSMLGGPPQK